MNAISPFADGVCSFCAWVFRAGQGAGKFGDAFDDRVLVTIKVTVKVKA